MEVREEVRLINLGSLKSVGASVIKYHVCVHVFAHVGRIVIMVPVGRLHGGREGDSY